MTAVNWDTFGRLPGSAQHNFEMLCRALIRRHYGRFGTFAALANQPGVEFHLKLHANCTLGSANEWFGWQCRWYGLSSGQALGTTRRRKIQEALATTERVLPGITTWILWTRYPLTKGDQKWFYGLNTKIHLELCTSTDVEDLLSGEAEIFRATYFGELVLTPTSLAILHEERVARVRRRWLPEAHQAVAAERTVRRMLGEAQSWDELLTVAERLSDAVKSIALDSNSFPAWLVVPCSEFSAAIIFHIGVLKTAHKLLAEGDLDMLREKLNSRPQLLDRKLTSLPRQLRTANNHAALMSTNAVADLKLAISLLDEINDFLGTRLIGVLADAGGGKTQLAAEVTSSTSGRPAGILIYGQDFHAGDDLDQLARKIVLPGAATSVSNMEALVAALDAAGQRAKRRLPIVIDGLNEAEDPRDWKGPLTSLNEMLLRYPYVLVICTLRTGARAPSVEADLNIIPADAEFNVRTAFADEALPDGVLRLEIPDFGEDLWEAMGKYFKYYKINPGEAELPFLLNHPLTLRLFCEVTNPKRAKEVSVEAMPGSLTALFEKYLANAAERIAELSPRSHRYYAMDVRKAFYEIGIALWNHRSRTISEKALRQLLVDESRAWDESIVRALEQEGVILRTPGNAPGEMHVMAVYDAIGGHLTANAILSQYAGADFEKWLKSTDTVSALSGPYPEAITRTKRHLLMESSKEETTLVHPLATDIFDSLVGLVPRQAQGKQLWTLLTEPLRTSALLRAATLEAAYLDNATITALSALPASEFGELFVLLRQRRGAALHPLNADFLDAVLRPLVTAERDLRWTEWLRRNHERFLDEVRHFEGLWKRATSLRTPSDRLLARWFMWILTTTVRQLRDQTTRALYWYGRGDPKYQT